MRCVLLVVKTSPGVRSTVATTTWRDWVHCSRVRDADSKVISTSTAHSVLTPKTLSVCALRDVRSSVAMRVRNARHWLCAA
jgi:hypothetical protein